MDTLHVIFWASVLASATAADGEPGKSRPVSKVITLLQDMLHQLATEAKGDEEVYDQMACWCETNDRAKTKAISDAESHVAAAQAQKAELNATSARLTVEIQNLESEVSKFQQSLATAAALRKKQLAAFNAEEKEMLESISALKSAIVVLSKHNADSMLQFPGDMAREVAITLEQEMLKHSDLVEGLLSARARQSLESFVQSSSGHLSGQPRKDTYTPKSGEVFGILKQMKETFQSNLAEMQQEEANRVKENDELVAAQTEQIQTSQQEIKSKQQTLAETDENIAELNQDIKDTQASLSADEQFLMKLKERCQMTDQEWDQRQKDRQLEMQAVSQALAVLSADDAHDTFTRTFNPVMLQTVQHKQDSKLRSVASQLLSVTAQRLHSPPLAALALHVRLDAFTKVQEAIDKMVTQLEQEQRDEIVHKDFCIGSLNQNELDTDQNTREKESHLAGIAALQTEIAQLQKTIDLLKTEIADLQLQLKHAGEDREKQNKDFHVVMADQQQTQVLLYQALNILEEFYRLSLVQQEPVDSASPPGFKEFTKNKQAPGIIGIIQQVIKDAKSMEAAVVRDEEDAQKGYEDFVQESNRSVDAKSTEIGHKSKQKAGKELDLTTEEGDLSHVETALGFLTSGALDLHSSCDFVLKNFEIRQTARSEEMEALKQAKAILSGARFSDAQE